MEYVTPSSSSEQVVVSQGVSSPTLRGRKVDAQRSSSSKMPEVPSPSVSNGSGAKTLSSASLLSNLSHSKAFLIALEIIVVVSAVLIFVFIPALGALSAVSLLSTYYGALAGILLIDDSSNNQEQPKGKDTQNITNNSEQNKPAPRKKRANTQPILDSDQSSSDSQKVSQSRKRREGSETSEQDVSDSDEPSSSSEEDASEYDEPSSSLQPDRKEDDNPRVDVNESSSKSRRPLSSKSVSSDRGSSSEESLSESSNPDVPSDSSQSSNEEEEVSLAPFSDEDLKKSLTSSGSVEIKEDSESEQEVDLSLSSSRSDLSSAEDVDEILKDEKKPDPSPDDPGFDSTEVNSLISGKEKDDSEAEKSPEEQSKEEDPVELKIEITHSADSSLSSNDDPEKSLASSSCLGNSENDKEVDVPLSSPSLSDLTLDEDREGSSKDRNEKDSLPDDSSSDSTGVSSLISSKSEHDLETEKSPKGQLDQKDPAEPTYETIHVLEPDARGAKVDKGLSLETQKAPLISSPVVLSSNSIQDLDPEYVVRLSPLRMESPDRQDLIALASQVSEVVQAIKNDMEDLADELPKAPEASSQISAQAKQPKEVKEEMDNLAHKLPKASEAESEIRIREKAATEVRMVKEKYGIAENEKKSEEMGNLYDSLSAQQENSHSQMLPEQAILLKSEMDGKRKDLSAKEGEFEKAMIKHLTAIEEAEKAEYNYQAVSKLNVKQKIYLNLTEKDVKLKRQESVSAGNKRDEAYKIRKQKFEEWRDLSHGLAKTTTDLEELFKKVKKRIEDQRVRK